MSNRWPWALGLILGIAALQAGLQSGAGPVESWQLAARWTARTGMPLLLIAYSASSLVRLWPNSLTKALLRDRRWWGLGFASCHFIHLYAIISYFRAAELFPDKPTLIGGGLAYILLGAMVLTSNHAAQRALGRNWKRLHAAGIHWLWFIFFIDMLRLAPLPEKQLFAIPGLALVSAALGLRIAAWAKTRAKRQAAA